MKTFAIALLVLCGWALRGTDACTAIGVTPAASASGRPILAHTDDAGGDTGDVRLVHVPRKALNGLLPPRRPVYKLNSGYPRLVSLDRGKDYKPSSEYNGKKRAQDLLEPIGFVPDISPLEVLDHSNRVVGLSPTAEDFLQRPHSHRFRYAYFDQDYGVMNEVQLSIVESTCGAKTVGWPADLPYGYNLFGIAELSKVALERCITARCAVQLMGDLAVDFGFFSEDSGDPREPGFSGSAEALILSDRLGEVWVFHVLTGLHNSSAVWAAKRVPEGEVTALANGFTIRELNFDDDQYNLFSPRIREVATELGLWSPQESTFDFTRVFAYHDPTPFMPLYVGRRIWRVFDTFAKSLKLDSTLGWITDKPTYPFSIFPDEPLKKEDVFSILKDHYEGTPYDMTVTTAAGPFGNPNRFRVNTKLPGAWERPISIWRSLFSFVVEVGTSEVDATLWYGPDKPHGTLYFPFYSSEVAVEEEFKSGLQSEFDFTSAWRVFNFLNNFAMLRYDVIREEIENMQDIYQAKAIELVENGAPSEELLSFRKSAVNGWWSFAWKIVAMYSDGYRIKGESPGQMETLGYPDHWLKTTEYTSWPGDTFSPPSKERKESLRQLE